MSDSITALRAYLDSAARAGNIGTALPRLQAAVDSSPQEPEIHFLHASVLLSLERHEGALDALGRALEIAPEFDAARFQRALMLFARERLADALDDFLQLTRSRPTTVEPWANAGVILLRMDRFAEAIPLLREAVRLQPRHAALRRSLANALRGAGVVAEAMALYASVLRDTPNDPAALTDYAMALLGIGEARTAHAQLLAALRIDPSDQTALAGLYVSANELGMQEIVDRLIDYGELLWVGMGADHGSLDTAGLRRAVLSHPGLVWQPAGRSTLQGRQSPMLDLVSPSPFSEFGRLVSEVVSTRFSTLRNSVRSRRHPWVTSLPTRWRIQAWCTVLDSGGRQTPHIHPSGRLSGVYYLDTGDAPEGEAGTLTFGRAPDDIQTSAQPRLHSVLPKHDQFCCFPSYFFHNTEPFRGTNGPRISLAFDVIPEL